MGPNRNNAATPPALSAGRARLGDPSGAAGASAAAQRRSSPPERRQTRGVMSPIRMHGLQRRSSQRCHRGLMSAARSRRTRGGALWGAAFGASSAGTPLSALSGSLDASATFVHAGCPSARFAACHGFRAGLFRGRDMSGSDRRSDQRHPPRSKRRVPRAHTLIQADAAEAFKCWLPAGSRGANPAPVSAVVPDGRVWVAEMAPGSRSQTVLTFVKSDSRPKPG